MKFKKTLLFLLPSLLFLIPGALCLGVEITNRQFRGLSTPFLMPGLGFILVAGFFLVRRPLYFFMLSVLTVAYGIVYLSTGGRLQETRSPIVYYYRTWSLNTQTGRLKLKGPLGIYPPEAGPYLVCHFAILNWRSYLDDQPALCTALDDKKRIQMFVNDHATEEGVLREFQLNGFQVNRKSLLGEPLDRGALRVAFTPAGGGLWPRFKIKKIYEAYEREADPGQMRVIESFSRDPQGKLESFTETSLLNLTSKEIYAVYDQSGILTKIPRMPNQNFAFPAKVDVSRVAEKSLPPVLSSNEANQPNYFE